jgi:hypothetical protein
MSQATVVESHRPGLTRCYVRRLRGLGGGQAGGDSRPPASRAAADLCARQKPMVRRSPLEGRSFSLNGRAESLLGSLLRAETPGQEQAPGSTRDQNSVSSGSSCARSSLSAV